MKGKGFVNFLAYLAIVLVALALILEYVLGALGVSATVVGAMSTIAQFISYAITSVFGFFYAKSKKSIAFMITYIIAVVLIVVFLFLTF